MARRGYQTVLISGSPLLDAATGLQRGFREVRVAASLNGELRGQGIVKMLRYELAQVDPRRYLVAEVHGGIVGYAGLMCIEPISDVQTIAVVPEQEGKGIGSALLTELIAESRRRHAQDVLLEVRADNPRAQQLYLRFGFEQIHVRPRYYRDGVDALIMRLQLPREPLSPQPTEAGRP